MIFEYLNSVRGQGQSSVRYIHDKLGYNYRMTNIQAALLYGQLEIQPEIREKKRSIFDLYTQELKDVEGIRFQETEANTEHAQWMFGLRFDQFNQQKKGIWNYSCSKIISKQDPCFIQ